MMDVLILHKLSSLIRRRRLPALVPVAFGITLCTRRH
jgi:hypothetical protein